MTEENQPIYLTIKEKGKVSKSIAVLLGISFIASCAIPGLGFSVVILVIIMWYQMRHGITGTITIENNSLTIYYNKRTKTYTDAQIRECLFYYGGYEGLITAGKKKEKGLNNYIFIETYKGKRLYRILINNEPELNILYKQIEKSLFKFDKEKTPSLADALYSYDKTKKFKT
jgi:hypothetical protein